MAVKMKDIADKLGVSISTVSRAMKNDPIYPRRRGRRSSRSHVTANL